jgi:hypothetical protein
MSYYQEKLKISDMNANSPPWAQATEKSKRSVTGILKTFAMTNMTMALITIRPATNTSLTGAAAMAQKKEFHPYPARSG